MTKQISHSPKAPRPFRHPAVRLLVLFVGWLSVALGFIGIFLPVLPTTPFLLLAAACFVRTSPKFYQWLIDHPRLGKYLVYYLDGQGMPMKAKIYTLILMWTMLLLTAFVIVKRPMLYYLLPAIGVGVSIYIMRLPTLAVIKPNSETTNKD